MDDRKKQIEEITAAIKEGVQNCMNSEQYKQMLSTMAKFTNYSFNNCILIGMQRPDATYVAGYKAWENKFDRHVEKGAKGIKIIQPAPFKKTETVEMKDKDGNTVRNDKGEPMTEKVEHIVQAYKVGYVFAYEDTSGTPLPEVCHKLDASVDGYDKIMEGLKAISPVPIVIEEINSGANGFFSVEGKDIHVKEGMSEAQTIKTTIHEMAHSIMHDKDTGTDKETNRHEREVEAESVAFTVSSYYGLDTSDYSFGYIAGWSEGKELPELTERLDMIRQTANEIITKLDDHFMKQELNEQAEMTYKTGAGYMRVYKEAEGYGCTLYDANLMHLKEDHIKDKDIKMDDVTSKFCESMKVPRESLVPSNQEHIRPILQQADSKFMELKLAEKQGLSNTVSHGRHI